MLSEGTNHLPGSSEKVLLLQARYAAGLDMWHPDDRQDNGNVDHSGSGCHREGRTEAPRYSKHRYPLHISSTSQRHSLD